MRNRPPPARRDRRRYPRTAYIPFALLVTVPLVLIVVFVLLIGRLVGGSGQHPSATPTVSQPARQTARPSSTVSVSTGAGHSGTPTPIPLLLVDIATGRDSAGAPINPGTLFGRDRVTLWAFVTLPRVHIHDAIQFVWRDLGRHSIVETWTGTITANAAAYRVSMYAYVGDSPSKPFPLGQYRVDVYHNARLVASGSFRVASHV